ncbi:MAG: magnesium transporter CorA [Firmicutes bacterium]|nr:magnesium transporter CorA [Bacillota bacterium]
MNARRFDAIFRTEHTEVHWYHFECDADALTERLRLEGAFWPYGEKEHETYPSRARFAAFREFYTVRWLVATPGAGATMRFWPCDLWVTPTALVTYTPQPSDVLFEIRSKLASSALQEPLMTNLVFQVLDELTARVFDPLDRLNDEVSRVEVEVFHGSRDADLKGQLFHFKREGYKVRRLAAQLRNVTSQMARHWTTHARENAPYALELYDHVVRLFDTANASSELINSVTDLYLNTVSNRLNEIVKTLTLVTTVLLPASLVAALYGMNFDYLPLAHYRWGFFVVLAVIGVVSGGLYWIFRRRRWL